MRFLKNLLGKLLNRQSETDNSIIECRNMSLTDYSSDMDSYIRILQVLRESREHPMHEDRKAIDYFRHTVCRLLKSVDKIKSGLSRSELYSLENRQRELENQYEWLFGKSD